MKIHTLKNAIKITIMIIIVLMSNLKNASAAPDIGVDFQWHHIDDNPLTNIQPTYSNQSEPWFFTKFAANTSPCTAAEHPEGWSSFGTKYRWDESPRPTPHHWYPYNFTTQIINNITGAVVAQRENIDCGQGHVVNDSPGTGFAGNYVGNYTIRVITPPPDSTWVQYNVNNHPSPPSGLRCFQGWRESWNGTRKELSTVYTYNTCSFTDNLPATIDGRGIITHIIHIYFRGKPAGPQNISATTVTNPAWSEGAGIQLQWDDITPNETRYLIIVRDTTTNTTLHTYSIGTGPGTDSVYNRQRMTHNIQFPGLCNGTNRTIYIRSENSWGNEGDVATAPISCNPALPIPSTPSNFQAQNDAPNRRITLTWNDTLYEDYYLLKIFNLDGNNITNPPTGIVIAKNTTVYHDTGICPSAPKRYELQAVNSSGASNPAITQEQCSIVTNQNTSGELVIIPLTPTGTISTRTRPELRFRGTATPSKIGNTDTRASLMYKVTINSPSTPQYTSIEHEEYMIVNTTYNEFDVSIPWPTYKKTPSDPVQNAESITITFILQSPDGSRNLSTPQSFTYTWTNHDTQAAIIPERQPLERLPEPYRSRKEISATPPTQISGGGTGFTDIESTRNFLISGLEYWVRLSIDGKQTTITQTIPNDIMLILDVTGSMTSEMLISNTSTEKITRIEAAKIALKQFVTNTHPNDFLGFGSYVICAPTTRKYDESIIDIVWAYEGVNAICGEYVGYGYVHLVPEKAQTAAPKINQLLKPGDPFAYTNRGINFCKNSNYRGGATDIGGGIITGLSMLTDVIKDQRRSDGTLYRSSMAGPFPGPRYRTETNKYIVLATDGKENIEPKAYSRQELLNQLPFQQPPEPAPQHAVEYAKNKNIRIYTVTIGHASREQIELMTNIAKDTKGEYYTGENLEQLTNSYKKILNEIQTISAPSSVIIQERINNEHFDIINLDSAAYRNNFVITKPIWNELQNRYEEQNMTNQICRTYSDCIANYSSRGVEFKLPQFGDNERYYIYFKVRAKAPGRDIDVNDNTSRIAFQDNTSRQLANKRVTIIEPEPFFTAAGNSVYSNANISSILIFSDEKFITDDKGISKAKGTQTFTNGQVSESGYQLNNYENKEKTSYINIREKFKDKIQAINTINTEFKISDLPPTSSSEGKEIYIQLNNTNTTSRKYKFIPPSSPLNDKIRRTIFIPGDLYITNNFETTPDGMTNILFIVEGNVGFNITVTKFDGIIIADGTIDTNCDTTTKEFKETGNKNTCEPDTLQNSQITLSGMFYANKGFQLDRKGNPNVTNRQAGERFIFRPDFYMSASKILGSPEVLWKEITN